MPIFNSDSAGSNDIAIGIIMLDTVFPRIPGDVGNPDTFSYPVLHRVVKGASIHRVVKEADPHLLQPFIEAAQDLEKQGVKAIATSCGFLAIFHQELVDSVHVPVFSSSLLQVHLAQSIIRRDQKVGIITAHGQSLTEKHFAGVGIQHYPKAVIGMEMAPEFTAVIIEGKRDIHVEKCRQEMAAVALKLVKSNPDVGAIVLECTNMPPYAAAVQAAVGLPVFDVVTMLNYAYATLVQQSFPEWSPP
jgi:Asp/Glu/hydantoin racemase